MYPEDPESRDAAELTLASEPLLERGRERLIAAVGELPLRYAPFYARLSALWDVSEVDVHAALLRAREPRAFRRTPLFGVRRLLVSTGPRLAGAESSLLLLEPGAHFPAHRHEGEEVALVLEGSYRDAGREYEPGDAQRMPPGSSHTLHVSDGSPCVTAVVSRGFAFTNLPLRLLQLLAKG